MKSTLVVIIVQNKDESAEEFSTRIRKAINDVYCLDEDNTVWHISFTTDSNGRQTFNMIYK
jgi:hypothetical protein